jgi:hypothetical protein
MPSSASTGRPRREHDRHPPEEVTIVDWPLRDRPLASSIALTLAAGLCWLAVWATGQPAAGIVLAVLLLLPLFRTLLPARYTLGPGGIEVSILGWRRKAPWSAIGHCLERSDGVVLTPDWEPSALPWQGLYLHWGDQREAVLAHLDYHVFSRASRPRHSSISNEPPKRHT